MVARNTAVATDGTAAGDPDALEFDDEPDRRFRLAVGGYAGVCVAGFAATVVAWTAGATATIVGTAAAGAPAGALTGAVLAGRVRRLSVRIGRTRRRRWSLAAPAIAFAAVWIGAGSLAPDSVVGSVALAAAVGVALTGWIVATLARNRYVSAVVTDEPAARTRWDPPSAPRTGALLVALFTLLGLQSAYAGNPTHAALWLGGGALYALGALIEGRWRFGSSPRYAELRVHEAGLVTERPYARSLVPWSDVRYARLRDGELVLNLGFFDVRFDEEALEDPEGVFAAIERALTTGDPR